MLGLEDSVCWNSRSKLQPFHHMAFLYGLMKWQRKYICAHSIAAIVIEHVLPGSNVSKLLRIPLSMNLRCLSRITPDQICSSFPKQPVILLKLLGIKNNKCFQLLNEPEEVGWLGRLSTSNRKAVNIRLGIASLESVRSGFKSLLRHLLTIT